MFDTIERTKNKLITDIVARFIVLFFSFIILFIEQSFTQNFNFTIVYAIGAIIFLLNLSIYLAVKKNKITFVTEYIISLIDFTLISCAIWFTQGLNSYLWFIYIVVVLIEGLALNQSHLVFNVILSLVSYPVVVYFHQQGVFEPQEILILTGRMSYIVLVGLISYGYANKLMKQQEMTEKLNQDNITLNSKLEEFSQVLSDEVNKATDALKDKIHEIEQLYRKFRNLFIDFARVLSAAVDARDPYTHGHTERVTKIALIILEEIQFFYGNLGINEEIKETLLVASLLHDIGKLCIPDRVLQKPGPLTTDEWIEMRKHPVIGQNILKPIEDLRIAGNIIRSHHERFDGKGYPDNLMGDDIPFLSRLICLSDSFDAMTSDRPYRPRMKIEDAIAEVKRCEGTQFDPVVVKAFLSAYKKGMLYVTE